MLIRTYYAGLCFLMAMQPALAWKMEAATITLQDTFVSTAFQSVSFQQSYDVVPLVFTLPTTQGGDPSAIRIRNVSSSGFEIIQLEPNANDGPHLSMTPVHYIAVEPGLHLLPDGRQLEAGFIDTTAVQHGSGVAGTETYAAVSWTAAFPNTPAVLAMVQTMNNESSSPPGQSSIPWLTTAIQSNSVTITGMNLALERSESAAGAVNVNERIAYLAVEGGVTGSFTDNAVNTINYEALISADNIAGYGTGGSCFTNNFIGSYSSPPVVVATKNRHDGGDGGWLRRCSLSNTAIGLVVDEDIDRDSERNHTTEAAGIIAFSQDFSVNFAPDIQFVKTVNTCSDPVNDRSNPKAISGALLDYTLLVENTGVGASDSNTVLVTDPIAPEASLFVGDLDDCVAPPVFVTGPFAFTDNGSGLSYIFSGLGNTTDSVEFSEFNTGNDFSYVPDPPGVGDTDAAGFNSRVRRIRISPNGAFAARNTAAIPAFSIRFRVRLE